MIEKEIQNKSQYSFLHLSITFIKSSFTEVEIGQVVKNATLYNSAKYNILLPVTMSQYSNKLAKMTFSFLNGASLRITSLYTKKITEEINCFGTVGNRD